MKQGFEAYFYSYTYHRSSCLLATTI